MFDEKIRFLICFDVVVFSNHRLFTVSVADDETMF